MKGAESQQTPIFPAFPGEYGCCLKTPCDQCLINMGACPFCHECKGGWYANDGAIRGKRAGDIKVMPRTPMPGH